MLELFFKLKQDHSYDLDFKMMCDFYDVDFAVTL